MVVNLKGIYVSRAGEFDILSIHIIQIQGLVRPVAFLLSILPAALFLSVMGELTAITASGQGYTTLGEDLWNSTRSIGTYGGLFFWTVVMLWLCSLAFYGARAAWDRPAVRAAQDWP